ncbi:MAG TPA: substrate-binding domain-containing protein [Capsulimonadaceae bacterium]
MECLSSMCDTLEPGARIPSHLHLMRQFNASERTVLRSIEELQRSGRLVRRAGSGTYVANTSGTATVEQTSPEPATRPRLTEPIRAGHGSDACQSIVVVASHDNSYLSRGIELIYDRASDYGIPVSYELPRIELIDALCVRNDANNRGFLVLGSNRYDLCLRIHATGARVVFVGSISDDIDIQFPCVNVNSAHGGYIATEHLIHLGHRHIGIVQPTSIPRYWGHESAVKAATEQGTVVTTSQITREQLEHWQTNTAEAGEYFSAPGHPTALCAWNDHDAIMLLTLLQCAGIRVPDDVSLVGYDDIAQARSVTPTLTTVDSKIEDRVRIALDILVQPLSQAPPCTHLVQPRLVVRASTGPRVL